MPENQNVEWKRVWSDKCLEELCGFANAQGGTIIVGMNDNGEIVGLPNAKKLLTEIPNQIHDVLNIVADVDLKSKDDLEYVIVTMPRYDAPISCKGVYYYRTGSVNQRLTGAALDQFLVRKREPQTWDNQPLPEFTLDDVDDKVVKRFLQLAINKGRLEASAREESKESLMRHLGLMRDGQLTNAAMLLFADDPERFLTGAYARIGFFEGADIRYQDEVHGSLLDQVDRIVETMHLKYMKAAIHYKKWQRIERYFVPDEALREAVANALCHRDYAYCTPLQIKVYEDKLCINSHGGFPAGWTAETLMNGHESIPHNPRIAKVYYRAGFIENFGRGIEKICNACREDKRPLPEYNLVGGSVMLTFNAPPDWHEQLMGHKVNDGLNEKLNDRLNELEQSLFALLAEEPSITVTELATKLCVSRTSIANNLKTLKAKGYIERVGSSRKGYWHLLGC